MIEFLTLLDSKGASFPDNQEPIKTSQACPQCHGKRSNPQPSKPDPKRKYADPDCWRCGGSRKIRSVGRQTQDSPGYQDKGLTPSYIAGLCSGVPQHKVDAGMVYVCHSKTSADRLLNYVIKNRLSKQAARWKMEPEKAAERAAGLAQAALIDLAIYPDTLRHEDYAAMLSVHKSTWQENWRSRQYEIFKELKTWCDDLNVHMSRMHRPSIDRPAERG